MIINKKIGDIEMKQYKTILKEAWDNLEKVEVVSSLSPEFERRDLKGKIGILDVRYSNAYSGSYQKMAVIGYDKKLECYITIGEVTLDNKLDPKVSDKVSYAFAPVDSGCENCRLANHKEIRAWLSL